MASVRLRPYRSADERRFVALDGVPGDIDFFEYRPTSGIDRAFAEHGFLGEDRGALAVEVDGEVVGDVGWSAVHHGPPPHGRAMNVGILLKAAHRGHGYGAEAQRLLAEHLFATTRIERLEATTDIDNVAEQRALEKAGFSREGVLRHAQWRAGDFHDTVIYSRLRGD